MTNTGDLDLTDIVVEDDMLGGDIPCGDALAVDAAITCGPVAYTVTAADATAGSVLVNTASVVANEGRVEADDPTSTAAATTPVDVESATIDSPATSAPATTTLAPTTTAKPTAAAPARLAATGRHNAPALGLGLALIIVGMALALLARKNDNPV